MSRFAGATLARRKFFRRLWSLALSKHRIIHRFPGAVSQKFLLLCLQLRHCPLALSVFQKWACGSAPSPSGVKTPCFIAFIGPRPRGYPGRALVTRLIFETRSKTQVPFGSLRAGFRLPAIRSGCSGCQRYLVKTFETGLWDETRQHGRQSAAGVPPMLYCSKRMRSGGLNCPRL